MDLAALKALCTEHPYPYELWEKNGVPTGIDGGASNSYITFDDESRIENDRIWLQALVDKANSIPALLARLEAAEKVVERLRIDYAALRLQASYGLFDSHKGDGWVIPNHPAEFTPFSRNDEPGGTYVRLGESHSADQVKWIDEVNAEAARIGKLYNAPAATN